MAQIIGKNFETALCIVGLLPTTEREQTPRAMPEKHSVIWTDWLFEKSLK